MPNIRFINGNVFQNNYNTNCSYTAQNIGSQSKGSYSRSITAFDNNIQFYSYWSKYLKDDSVFNSLSSVSGSAGYNLYKRNQNYTALFNPDYVKSLSSRYFNISRSITGNGRQYITDSSSGLGWFFPYQRSFIIRNNLGSTTSITAIQNLSYYMSQSSFYARVVDRQLNNSNLCITRINNTNQFIRDKATYITTISLIDDDNNTLAIGKFCRPIQKLNFIPMSFKLRFFN